MITRAHKTASYTANRLHCSGIAADATDGRDPAPLAPSGSTSDKNTPSSDGWLTDQSRMPARCISRRGKKKKVKKEQA